MERPFPMVMRTSSLAVRFTAFAASIGLLVSLGACSSDDGRPAENTANGTTVTAGVADGAVAIFTPSDGITISQHTPLNKWTKLVPEITDALKDEGLPGDHVDSFASDSLDKQSRAVQDYVVDHLSAHGDDDVDATHTTLLVAPVVSTDKATRQYGDYVSQQLTRAGEDSASDTDDTDGSDAGADGSANNTDSSANNGDNVARSGEDVSDNSADSSEATANSSDQERDALDEQREAFDRLTSALKLAQESGMHVVLMANTIEGYSPDAFVEFSDAHAIGKSQADKLVSKLELSKVSKDNPKYIEILLPYDTDTDGKSDDTALSEGFAKEAFAGAWSTLQPYFASGVLRSASGILDASTTDDDWRTVAYDASEDNATAMELDDRLGLSDGTEAKDDKSAHTRIDGIIAMNDYVASDVVDELNALGYTGSAADINPSITISGIVGNITGKKDLSREAVPDPIKAPDETSDEQSEAGRDSQWPLVTGYGAYVGNMPNVVNGKQWMTGLENRKDLANDIAQACVRLNTGDSLDGMDSVGSTTIADKKTPTISEDLLAVSAYNLKSELITPGYISMADAGL